MLLFVIIRADVLSNVCNKNTEMYFCLGGAWGGVVVKALRY